MGSFFGKTARRTSMRKKVMLADVAGVKRVVRSTGFFSESEIEMAGELVEAYLTEGKKSGYRFLFLEEGDQLAGFACYGEISCANQRYDLYWIAVDPEKQGKGLGRKIIEEVESEIRGLGGQKVYIETSSRRQYLPTRKFYRARGYREEAQLKDFYGWGDNKVIFSKVLQGGVGAEGKPAGQERPMKIRKIALKTRPGR